jgi:hypothetical protein
MVHGTRDFVRTAEWPPPPQTTQRWNKIFIVVALRLVVSIFILCRGVPWCAVVWRGVAWCGVVWWLGLPRQV